MEPAGPPEQPVLHNRAIKTASAVCDWNAEVIIWLQGAADLLLSFTSEASPRCHRDDYLS